MDEKGPLRHREKHRKPTLESRLAILVPEVDRAIAASRRESALNRMELDVVDWKDLVWFSRVARIFAMAFEGEIIAAR